MRRIKVCHMTSVHPADDVRIYHKECKTLAAGGWDVYYIGSGNLDTGDSGVRFSQLPASGSSSRLKRMVFRAYTTYRMARAVHADIYHFHDPELLPWGLLLKWQGKHVIYDAHEDLPRDILAKAWIPAPLRRVVAWISEKVENFVARRMDLVITATPFIRDRFLREGARAVDINNYPMLQELALPVVETQDAGAGQAVCYAGAISEERGAFQIVDALGYGNVRLHLAGAFAPPSLREKVSKLPGWSKVIEHGQVKRTALPQILGSSIAGLVLFHPVPNNVNAQPNKLFEYMSAGLPVVASDFPLWREIIDGFRCGICVDPMDSRAIATGIAWIYEHPSEAHEMGRNGREAVLSRYNWESEAKRLQALYSELVLS